VKLSLQFFLAAALVIRLRSGTGSAAAAAAACCCTASLPVVVLAAAVTVVLAVRFLLGDPGGDVEPGSAINVKVRPFSPPASVALRT
jgi:hypothetical protein